MQNYLRWQGADPRIAALTAGWPKVPAGAKGDHMTTEMRSWQDCLVDTIREEIALGMVVAVQLPGLPGPVLVEDAIVEGALVLLSDQPGTRHYIGSMAGVVLLAAPLEGEGTGTWRPHSWTPTMNID